MQVVRVGAGTRIQSDTAAFTATLLAAGSRHARRDLYMIELGPAAVRHAEAHTPGSLEHVVVGAGRLRAATAARPPWRYACRNILLPRLC